jgi:PmbA protein
MPQNDDALLEPLADLVARALKAGADAADAVRVKSVSAAAACRLGRPERVERAESDDVGLRVLVGKRQAVVSTTDLTPLALAELVERAIAMARTVPEDAFCGLAEPDEITRTMAELDLVDALEPEAATLAARAREAEDAARAVDGVTNSEGAEAGWSRANVALVASNGFSGAYARTGHSLSVAVLAGAGTAMERDYEFSAGVHLADLLPAAEVGRRAGERAVRRLGARKAKTARVPVVFERRVAGSLLRHLAGAINGREVARGTSFLKDRMNEAIFPAAVSIVDDPLRRRGLRSRPFDGEGIAGTTRRIVDRGRLTSWILDLHSARQLGLGTTGHAARSTSSPPMPAATNLYMEPGEKTPEALIRDIDVGFLVTEMIGFGVNGVTGDYSRGATGFWIEKGEVSYPVSEVTIAGNLKDMFLHLAAADDLVFQFGTDAPTLCVDGMTVAGK